MALEDENDCLELPAALKNCVLKPKSIKYSILSDMVIGKVGILFEPWKGLLKNVTIKKYKNYGKRGIY